MLNRLARSLWVLLGVVGVVSQAQAQVFTDPAPPVVEKLEDVAPPVPQKHEGLKFRAAPHSLAAGAVTQDWRTFLGPTHNAISTETSLLNQFGKNGPPIVWEVTKGEGYASPAVIGERVILFHRVEGEEVVECLQAETGQRYWKYAYPTTYRDSFGWSAGPRCQPISDGQFVYTYGAEGKLHCLKLATGQVVWKRDILKEFRGIKTFFGIGATPLLDGDLLIVNVGAEKGPCVAAFQKQTGKMVWGQETNGGRVMPLRFPPMCLVNIGFLSLPGERAGLPVAGCCA